MPRHQSTCHRREVAAPSLNLCHQPGPLTLAATAPSQDGNGPTRPWPGLGPGPMASRPILGVMDRSIFSRCYGFDGPLGIMGRPKYFFYNPKPRILSTLLQKI